MKKSLLSLPAIVILVGCTGNDVEKDVSVKFVPEIEQRPVTIGLDNTEGIDTTEWEVYTDESHNFQIKYPEVTDLNIEIANLDEGDNFENNPRLEKAVQFNFIHGKSFNIRFLLNKERFANFEEFLNSSANANDIVLQKEMKWTNIPDTQIIEMPGKKIYTNTTKSQEGSQFGRQAIVFFPESEFIYVIKWVSFTDPVTQDQDRDIMAMLQSMKVAN